MTREEWLKIWAIPADKADEAWAEKQSFEARQLNALVMRDLEPYQAMGTDVATGTMPVISSRSQHREFLKRNGYAELGNDKPQTFQRTQEMSRAERFELGREIKQVMDAKGIRA